MIGPQRGFREITRSPDAESGHGSSPANNGPRLLQSGERSGDLFSLAGEGGSAERSDRTLVTGERRRGGVAARALFRCFSRLEEVECKTGRPGGSGDWKKPGGRRGRGREQN